AFGGRRKQTPLVRPHGTGLVQKALHENKIEPTAELAPNLGHARHLDETGTRVQPDRSLVAAVDAGDQHMLAKRTRSRDQFVDDHSPRPWPATSGANIDVLFDAVATAGPALEIAKRAIADNVAAFGRDQHRIA